MAQIVTVDLDKFRAIAFEKALNDIKEDSLNEDFVINEMFDKQKFIDDLLNFCVVDNLNNMEKVNNGNG